MKIQQPGRRIGIGIAVSVLAMALAACSPGEQQAANTDSSPTPSATAIQPTTSPQASVQPSVQPSAQQLSSQKTVQVYWLKSSGSKIEVVPAPVKIQAGVKSENILEGAFNRLLAGPNDPAYSSTIPKGTQLRNLDVREDGVHVDLSQEFTAGGGSASMTGRVAQILYTATSINPNTNVWIDVEGKRLEVLGGEGLELNQPLTRQNFEKNFDL
ncbi:GerMN domain-containing protein [Trichocoleus sp. ST-U3]|uniref:GerMN domain-containing protein n=1 Tax=Coleofasciculus sp. FACHB-542 TaxID=2692787 RepID=UPI0016832041|nr:GerMN domain-containing protein [Coleofasciculus sp. FACHB-542]MBD2085799.1 GerMN domain-containing protein [Coleofasciculus sp. FACHB-542]